MKKAIIGLVALFSMNLAIGQTVPKNDPTYSASNYKHPNKAAYAKKHMVSQSTTFDITSVIVSENYKHPDMRTARKKAILPSDNVATRSNRSYKHPYGR
ncbi:hypothetical protein [Algoriphagus sp. A40]|uniref:hypothetical protein n=1 Tax=Algoriphagus sp. A40 TaxID=1945863 RepID=UPI000987D430|nr:hypothetical protein [Algoriphagus sp. A40]OOG77889.1 hypothetical protein B0E43_03765 [Algoriphagus sp. A40]